MAHIDTVKQWFETGDFPTQAQFYTWMELQRWKDEKIEFSDLSPTLQAIINTLAKPVQVATLTAGGYVDITADCEVWMVTAKSATGGDVIKYSKSRTVAMVETLTVIEEAMGITADVIAHSNAVFDLLAGDRIFFEGITNSTTIKIYKA